MIEDEFKSLISTRNGVGWLKSGFERGKKQRKYTKKKSKRRAVS